MRRGCCVEDGDDFHSWEDQTTVLRDYICVFFFFNLQVVSKIFIVVFLDVLKISLQVFYNMNSFFIIIFMGH